MNLSANIPNITANMMGFKEPLTRDALANQYCTSMYGYLLTIFIIIIIYCIYDDDIRPFIRKSIQKIKDDKLRLWLIKKNFPQEIKDSLSFLSFTGAGVIIYFYKDYLSLWQKTVLLTIICILAVHRLIDLSKWVISKATIIMAKKGMDTSELDEIIEDEKSQSSELKGESEQEKQSQE